MTRQWPRCKCTSRRAAQAMQTTHRIYLGSRDKALLIWRRCAGLGQCLIAHLRVERKMNPSELAYELIEIDTRCMDGCRHLQRRTERRTNEIDGVSSDMGAVRD